MAFRSETFLFLIEAPMLPFHDHKRRCAMKGELLSPAIYDKEVFRNYL